MTASTDYTLKTLFELKEILTAKGYAFGSTIKKMDALKLLESPPVEESLAQSAAFPEKPKPTAGNTEPAKESEEAMLDRLSKLSAIAYDRLRTEAAKLLSIRPGTLDKIVNSRRKDQVTSGDIDFDDVESWDYSVNGAELLDTISNTVRRFIICQKETADAVALWLAMTWFIDVVQIAPLAVITAPEKRCGKSQLLFLIGKMSYRPLAAANISPAALFRSIDAWKPTLIIDEADSFMKENEDVRGILNCGHTRDSAYIIRTVGDAFTPKRFNVWGAKALAGIGRLADTLMDRAVTLELRRKLPHETVDRLRYAEPDLFENLSSMLARFSEDNREAVRMARPPLPPALNDRAQDNWEPLLAIAQTAGGAWLERATKAALILSGSDSPSMTIGTELLTDIQHIFERKNIIVISSANLILELCIDEEGRWATYNRGRAITPRQVSSRLKEYGVLSKNVRIGIEVLKGYTFEQFKDVFSRYLDTPPEISATTLQTNIDGVLSVAGSEITNLSKNDEATRRTANLLACSGVADFYPVAEENDDDIPEINLGGLS